MPITRSKPLELPSTDEQLLNTRDFAHRSQGDLPKGHQKAPGGVLFNTLEKLGHRHAEGGRDFK